MSVPSWFDVDPPASKEPPPPATKEAPSRSDASTRPSQFSAAPRRIFKGSTQVSHPSFVAQCKQSRDDGAPPRREKRVRLSDSERESMSRHLEDATLRRVHVERAMFSFLDLCRVHPDAVEDAVGLLVASMTAPPPAPGAVSSLERLVGRLFVVSDVLLNARRVLPTISTSLALKLQPKLGFIFHLVGNELRHALPPGSGGVLTSRAWTRRVERVVEVWIAEAVFSPGFLQGLLKSFRALPSDVEAAKEARELWIARQPSTLDPASARAKALRACLLHGAPVDPDAATLEEAVEALLVVDAVPPEL